MKKTLLFAFLLMALGASAQSTLTTFILVRHAEKKADGSKNPELTEEGEKRAQNLVTLLQNTPVAAVYSTDYIRTRSTVEPLATTRSLPVKTYEPFKKEPIDKMLTEYAGKTVVICGHSNNIPWIANYLQGTESIKDFADTDYGNMLILTVTTAGHASVTWLRF
jgi:broad specificity phosphatase PhoE